MKVEALLEELKNLAERMEITVRSEIGRFSGGYCLLREKKLIVINRKMPVENKVAVLARSIAQFPLENVFIKPALREFIDDERAKAAAESGDRNEAQGVQVNEEPARHMEVAEAA